MARPAMTRPHVILRTNLDRSLIALTNEGFSCDWVTRSTCARDAELAVGSGRTKHRRDGKKRLMPRRILL